MYQAFIAFIYSTTPIFVVEAFFFSTIEEMFYSGRFKVNGVIAKKKAANVSVRLASNGLFVYGRRGSSFFGEVNCAWTGGCQLGERV